MKLEVGDIKMDSEAGISFGPHQPSTDPHTLTTSEHVARRRAEEGVSIGLIASIVASVGILGSWVVTTMVALEMLTPYALAIWGPVLGNCAALWWVTRHQRLLRGAEVSGGERDESTRELSDARSARLIELIEAYPLGLTVDELVSTTGWREAAVLEGLEAAVARGQLEEDLDIDLGVWRYALTDRVILHDSSTDQLTLGERIAEHKATVKTRS